MTKSDSIKNIAGALVKFHSEVGKVKKSETNPFFKSKYADLSAILDVIDEPLQKAGLSYVQFPHGEYEMTTLLMHAESGEWIEDTFKMTPVKNDPQGQGSVITYQRRYAIGSILGLNIDNDDDGNKASGNAHKTAYTPRSASKTTETTLSSDEVFDLALKTISDAKNLDDISKVEHRIKLSKLLSPEHKLTLAVYVKEKAESFDPTE